MGILLHSVRQKRIVNDMQVDIPCVHQCAQIGDAIAHCDLEAEACDDANNDGSHQSARDNLSGVLTSFSEMQGRVDAGVHEAGRREAG